jgi:hypothetical protein
MVSMYNIDRLSMAACFRLSVGSSTGFGARRREDFLSSSTDPRHEVLCVSAAVPNPIETVLFRTCFQPTTSSERMGNKQ